MYLLLFYLNDSFHGFQQLVFIVHLIQFADIRIEFAEIDAMLCPQELGHRPEPVDQEFAVDGKLDLVQVGKGGDEVSGVLIIAAGCPQVIAPLIGIGNLRIPVALEFGHLMRYRVIIVILALDCLGGAGWPSEIASAI